VNFTQSIFPGQWWAFAGMTAQQNLSLASVFQLK
jgi:hypothetical protein